MRKRDIFNPRVSRCMLLSLAALIWIIVGTVLVVVAYSWLEDAHAGTIAAALVAGFSGALVIHRFGFLKIVDKNVNRIMNLEEKSSVFSFMPWRSYLIVAFMMTLGYVLRHSSIPKHYLAILYFGIGAALVLSSMRYVQIVFRIVNMNRTIN